MRSLVIAVVLLFLTASAASSTIYVVRPDGTGDFPTIQAAIDAAQSGDIVELTDGTFTGDGNRDIDFLNKAVAVRSQSGDAALCIIDCQGTENEPRRAFIFQSGESAASELDGITITGGYRTAAYHRRRPDKERNFPARPL